MAFQLRIVEAAALLRAPVWQLVRKLAGSFTPRAGVGGLLELAKGEFGGFALASRTAVPVAHTRGPTLLKRQLLLHLPLSSR